jgi:hypothetical protein
MTCNQVPRLAVSGAVGPSLGAPTEHSDAPSGLGHHLPIPKGAEDGSVGAPGMSLTTDTTEPNSRTPFTKGLQECAHIEKVELAISRKVST